MMINFDLDFDFGGLLFDIVNFSVFGVGLLMGVGTLIAWMVHRRRNDVDAIQLLRPYAWCSPILMISGLLGIVAVALLMKNKSETRDFREFLDTMSPIYVIVLLVFAILFIVLWRAKIKEKLIAQL